MVAVRPEDRHAADADVAELAGTGAPAIDQVAERSVGRQRLDIGEPARLVAVEDIEILAPAADQLAGIEAAISSTRADT